MSANPLKEDPELKALLKNLTDIATPDDFQRWRNNFLDRFNDFLDTDASEQAAALYRKFSKEVTILMRLCFKLKNFIDSGDLTVEKCSVNARLCLSELANHVTVVCDLQEGLLPATTAQEEACGFNKFNTGAILVRDNFSDYRRLEFCGKILAKIRNSLVGVAGEQVLATMDLFKVKFDRFCDIMADLGLLPAMLKSTEVMPKEDSPEARRKDSPSPVPPSPAPALSPKRTKKSVSKDVASDNRSVASTPMRNKAKKGTSKTPSAAAASAVDATQMPKPVLPFAEENDAEPTKAVRRFSTGTDVQSDATPVPQGSSAADNRSTRNPRSDKKETEHAKPPKSPHKAPRSRELKPESKPDDQKYTRTPKQEAQKPAAKPSESDVTKTPKLPSKQDVPKPPEQEYKTPKQEVSKTPKPPEQEYKTPKQEVSKTPKPPEQEYKTPKQEVSKTPKPEPSRSPKPEAQHSPKPDVSRKKSFDDAPQTDKSDKSQSNRTRKDPPRSKSSKDPMQGETSKPGKDSPPADGSGSGSKEAKVCAVQAGLRKARESPVDAIKKVLEFLNEIASKEKVDLFVLPELCPVGYSEDTFENYLPRTPTMQTMYHRIDSAFATKACNLQAYIAYGTIGWKEQNDGELKFFIRQIVLDRTGVVVAKYDKAHLCDYGDCKETRYFEPGVSEKPPVFTVNGLRFGMLICSDMRYPDLSRNLVRDHKVDVLVQPSAFSRDMSFRTWRSFRETRAVENSVYFVGINYGGSNYGESNFVPPWVDKENEPVELGTTPGYLAAVVQQKVLDRVRSEMPFYRHLMEADNTKCCCPKDRLENGKTQSRRGTAGY